MAGGSQQYEDEMVLPCNPVIWRGTLELCGSRVPIHLHHVSGSLMLSKSCMPKAAILSREDPVLRMQGTVKLNESKLQDIANKTQHFGEHSILIGMSEAEEDARTFEKLVLAQRLKNIFVDFLAARRRVGFAPLLDEEETFTLHAFPHCQFSEQYIENALPEDAFLRLQDTAYLVFILTKNNSDDDE